MNTHLRMPDLPQDILTYIVEVISDPRTQWTLLTASRHISSVVLMSMYQDISIDSGESDESMGHLTEYIITLHKLTHSASSNPNLHRTKSFSFCCFHRHEVQDRFAQALLPQVTNLQRLAINCPHIDSQTLSFLPRGVRLTHLILDTITYSNHFIRFLETQPELRLLAVSMFQEPPLTGSTEQSLSPAIPLSRTALPQLRSLKCPTRVIPQFGNRPAIVDLTFTCNTWSERYKPFPVEVKADMGCFRSVCSVYILNSLDFQGITSVIRELPNLEYFGMHTSMVKLPLPWHLLGTTPLKYVQFGDILRLECAAEMAADVFSSIPSVGVVDVYQDGYGLRRSFQRFCRHAPMGISVQICRTQWQTWWEPVAREIHDMCADH
ncbi:hypothetical protein AB1N83_004036 [Pleurotus pulmonarius]